MNIYVGNLPRSVSDEALRSLFQRFGAVQDVRIIKDGATGEPRGFAFVEMPTRQEAVQAIVELNGTDFEGRRLKVTEAQPRPERRSFDRRFGSTAGGGRDFGNRSIDYRR